MNIGYLVSDYHAPSHTFVRREIEGLRALGETVLPFGIRGDNPAGSEDVPTVLGNTVAAHIRSFLGHLVARPLSLGMAWRKSLSHRPPGIRSLLWSQFHFIEASTLAAMLGDGRVERLHSHFANSGAVVGMLASHIVRIPWSLTLHGISETDYPAGYLLPAKLEQAQFVAIASLFMRAQAMRVTRPEIWDRYHIVRCGIDPSNMPKRKRLTNDLRTRIVCVGRLSPEKGYLTLFEALGLLEKRSARFEVAIVGEGPERALLEASAARICKTSVITFHGALSEAETLDRIADADVLVLPSLMEGLPVVLMEAMAIGVPVIASRIAGIPELVEHGVSGLTFTPTDAPGLADAIQELADDPVLAARLVANGRERIVQSFTTQTSARRMQRLFRGKDPS